MAPFTVARSAARRRHLRRTTRRRSASRSNVSLATASRTNAQNGSTGCNSGVQGGRKGSTTLAGTANRLAVCHPVHHQHQDLLAVRVGVGGEGGQGVGHPLDLHPRRDHRERLPGPRAGEAVHVEPLVLGLPARVGPAPPQPPDPAGDRLEPQPRLVLGPHLDRLGRVRGPQPPHPPSQVFFHCRRVGWSAERGWEGRGTCNVNPRSTSHRHPVTGPTDTPHRSRT